MNTESLKNIFKSTFVRNFVLWLAAFVCVLICSTNSFLYTLNIGSDFNYNLIVVREMLQGSLPYRDIFTQNGPVVLSLFAIFAVKSRIMIFLEIICAGAFISLIYRIANKCLNNYVSIVASIIVTILTFTSTAFVTGGTVEQFLLPAFAYLLLAVIEYIFENKQFSVLRTILFAICFSLIFWCKSILIILPMILLIAWVIYCFKNKHYKHLLSRISIILVTTIIISLIMVWYLFMNGVLREFVSIYFYHGVNIVESLKKLLVNILLVSLSIVGVVLGQIVYKKQFTPLSICAGLYLISLFFTANESFYILPLSIFASLGVILLMKIMLASKLLEKTKNITIMAIVILSMFYCVVFSTAIWQKRTPIQELTQVQVAAAIDGYRIEKPTLLCYKIDNFAMFSIDGLQPGTKVFVSNENIKLNEQLMNEFNIAITEQSVDFVLLEKQEYENNKKFFKEYYREVKEYTYYDFEDVFKGETSLVLLKKL